MVSKKMKNYVIIALIFLGILFFLIVIAQTSGISNPSSSSETEENKTIDLQALVEEVVPSEGVVLDVRWGDFLPKLVQLGVLNATKFEYVMERNGLPLTQEQRRLLYEPSNEKIEITRENSVFIVNVFWALGLANKNPVLTNSPMESYGVHRFASTGGWILGNEQGGNLFNKYEIISLTPEQQEIVDYVAKNVYRPCCNNPTSFPDCNHGMAALGIAELMASQGFNKEEIFKAILIANSYWFPQTYVDTALYLHFQGKDWKKIPAEELLGYEFSSASGYISTRQKLQALGGSISLPAGRCS